MSRAKARIGLLFGVLLAMQLALVGDVPTADDPNHGLSLEVDPLDDVSVLSWFGVAGESYFIEVTPDLTTEWAYIDHIYPGTGGVLSHGFATNADALFYRLKYTDRPVDDPWDADFDGDGIGNQAELDQDTDPFGFDDSDGNGIPDDWEKHYFGSTGIDPDADPDGDGFSNLTEFEAGLNPHDSLNGQSSAGIAPAAPSRLRVADGPDFTSAHLSWQDNSDNEVLFRIERQRYGQPFQTVGVVPADTTHWTETGLDPEVIHIYRVFAVGN